MGQAQHPPPRAHRILAFLREGRGVEEAPKEEPQHLPGFLVHRGRPCRPSLLSPPPDVGGLGEPKPLGMPIPA